MLEIRRCLKPMRGGSQSHLVAVNGNFYVAKFAENPQGNRTLANERISDWLLQQLGISAAPTALLTISDQTIASNRLVFRCGKRVIPVRSGIHLGSLCPVDPNAKAIFDVLPVSLLPTVDNIDDIGFMFVFDIWVCQIDRRQLIFVRNPMPGSKLRFKCFAIDHGFAFSGSLWRLSEPFQYGRYFDLRAYKLLDMPRVCMQAIDRIAMLSNASILQALETIPREWLAISDYHILSDLLHRLDRRRERLPALVDQQLVHLQGTGM